MAARKEIPRELSIYINDKQVINSLAGVTREITRTNTEMRNLNKNSATYDQDLKKLQGTLSQLRDRQSEFKEEIHNTSEVAGEAREKISQIFLGLASGNLSLVKEGLNGIKGSIIEMTRAGMAFIATPIGAAIAVLSGIAIGTKAIFDFNVEAEKSAVLLENLTGKTGQVVEDIRVRMKSLTDTFGIEFNNLANAVDNLVDTGAVKDEFEALDLIKQGLLTAPDKNEFIASLESSAVAAKNIGADLEEVIAIKKQIEETGLDPEKSFGAYQKAANNLALQSDKLREKLSGALGASFTDDVLAKVKTGQITTVQALDAIGKKSQEVGLNQQQQAELGKELFGKAGIAAGGYAVLVNNIVESEKKRTTGLNENQKALDELEKANLKVAKAQSELFRIENFGGIWTMIKAKATDALGSILEWIIDIKDDIQPLIDLVGVVFAEAWEGLKLTFSLAFDFIGGTLKVFSNAVSTVFNFVKKIFTGDFSGALDVLKNGFKNFGNIVNETFGKVKNSILSGLQGILGAVKPFLEALGLDVDKIQKKLESFKSKQVEVKVATSTDDSTKKQEAANTKATQEELAAQAKIRDDARQKEREKRLKEQEAKKKEEEKAAKEKLDRENALAKAMADLSKAELNYFIANNRSKLESGQKLTQELVDQEIKRLDDIKFKKENELAEERLRQIASAEQSAKSAEELAVLKQSIDYNYLVNQQALDLEFQQNTAVLKKQFKDQQTAEELLQLQIDFEVKQALLDSQTEIEALKRDTKYQEDKDKYYKYLQDGYITKKQFDDLVAALDKKKREDERIAEIVSVQGKLNELAKLAAATTAIFGQNKASASATAVINGGLAITEILKTPSVFPEPFASISRGVQIAGAIATTVNALKQINSAKAPTTAKFFYGGYTGNSSALGNDEYGPVTGVVHSNEYVVPAVMAQSPKYAATLSWLENERKGIIGNKYFNGGPVTTTSSPIANSVESNDEMQQLMRAILFRLENPITPKLSIGYDDAEAIDDLNKEKKQSQLNGTIS